MVRRPQKTPISKQFGGYECICRDVTSVQLAERVGFEPTVRLPIRRISSAVLSTTQPPLRRGIALAGRVPAPVGRGAL